MNQKEDIELPLLSRGSSSSEKHGKRKKKTNRESSSDFNDYVSFPSKSDKYAPKPNFFTWLTFADIWPYIKRMNQTLRNLTVDDLPKPERDFNIPEKVFELETNWNEEKRHEKPSFLKAVFRTFKLESCIGSLLLTIDATTKIFYSLYMGRIINVITARNVGIGIDSQELIVSGIFLSVLVIISVFAKGWGIYVLAGTVGKARLAISGLLYKKLHSTSLTSLHEIKLGKVMNLIGNDLNDMQALIALPNIFITPYMSVIGTIMLWQYIGPTSLIALGLLLCVVFLQSFCANLTETPRKDNKKITDERLKITHEMIEGIRLIKMYTWDKVFKSKILDLRESEHKTFMKIMHTDAVSRNISTLSVYLIILIVCFIYMLMGGILSAEKVYGSMVILIYLSSSLLSSHQARMSLVNFKMISTRVEEVLLIKDITLNKRLPLADSEATLVKPVIFRNFEGYWSKNADKPCLSDITLTFKPGTITAIIGKIGSGKTTLLLSFLKELPVTSGTLDFNGSLAFVEQDPIIFSGTMRENILFGREFDEELYTQVIKDCCLEKDLDMLSFGDLTLIGERGVNLSGGQKARVSLARALYSQSDVYLLDDPFSALDSRVTREIFDRVLKKNIAKNKIVILVTHHLHFAKESDHVVFMDEGKALAQGRFSDLEKLNLSLLSVFKVDEPIETDEKEAKQLPKSEQTQNKQVISKEKEEEVKEEITETSLKTYKDYLTAIGTFSSLFAILALYVSSHFIMIYYSKFLGTWAEEQARASLEDSDYENSSNGFYTIWSLFLLFVIFTIGLIKIVKIYDFLIATNTEIHLRMLNCLIRAPTLFFDINPVGRIINRFSNDMGNLDKNNPRMAFEMVDNAIGYISVMITVSLLNFSMIPPCLVVVFGLYKIRMLFDKPMIQTKSLELRAKSPMLSAIPSTLQGLTIIRVYNQGERFMKQYMEMMYVSIKGYVFREKMIRLFALMLDAPVQFLTLSGIWIFITMIYYYNFESALLGLSLMYLLKIGDQGSLIIRHSLYVDLSMQNAQRMLEYCHIKSEAPAEIPEKDTQVKNKFEGMWPNKGEIIFNRVYLRYREGLNFALKGLSLNIAGGLKVGCIGRTGAGKSSIIQALFRMVEIEKESGFEDSFIKIDGVDIGSIGLNLLRSHLSIIPQTPAIFTGTIRRNLDPLGKLSDYQLWEILDQVCLKNYVSSLPQKLDTDMTVSATVFSTGQKQLVCLARAIINKSKVIILDEATANVDVETDSFIQQTIMNRFKDCTVLTVAHRLITIANYDKVVVIDDGKVVEYDSPYNLLVENIGDNQITRKNSLFAEMVKSTGISMSNKIFEVAQQQYYSSHGTGQ